MYIPGRAISPVRRAMSMVVPMSSGDADSTRLHDDDDDDDDGNGDSMSLPHRMTQSDIVLRHSSDLDHIAKSYRRNEGPLQDVESGCYFEDGILLPPSPFRSPEFAGDAETGTNGHVADPAAASYHVDRFGLNSVAANNRPYPRNMNDHQRTGIGAEDRDRMLWMTMSSPDDVTPTNENQPPPGFGQQTPKSPAPQQNTGHHVTPASNASEVPDLYQLRYSEL